jgi:predicted glycosyltransferase involved in capsule biosynthesis
MRVLVAIPWRPQSHRVHAHELTVARYRELLPDAFVMNVDTEHEPFCLAACRNLGVCHAELGGHDVVVLADADTLPEREPLLAAIEGARTSGRVHLPYTEYRALRADGTKQHRSGVPLEDCNHFAMSSSCGGILVTTPATWWAVGGQDERFRGWGMEDVAFLVSHQALLGGDMVRHDGRIYALHHESATKHGPQYDANVELYRRYLDAAETGDPDAVWVLAVGPGCKEVA